MCYKQTDMKKTIFEALKAKFNGVPDAILERIAVKMAKTVTTEEQAQAAVEAFTLAQLLESYGDNRATDATKTAVMNYEKTHGLKDGKPVAKTGADPNQGADTDPADDPDMPAWAKNINKQLNTLTERITKMDGERTTTARRQQLAAITDKLPEALRKAYERVSVENLTDEEFNALTGEITSEVEGIAKEMGAKGAVFGRPAKSGGNSGSGNEKEATDAEVQAVVDRLSI